MTAYHSTKYKQNYKERMKSLGFENIGDLSFWNDKTNLRRIMQNKQKKWIIDVAGVIEYENISVIECVEYLEGKCQK